MIRTLVIAGCAGAVLAVAARGQSGATSGKPNDPNPEKSSGVGKYSNWDQVAAHQHGSLELTGKVVVVGGQIPWDPVPVVITCDGKARYNTQTDPKGGFRVEAAPTQSEVSPDVANPKRGLPAQLTGCTARAVLQGFQSSSKVIGERNILDDPDVGTIELTRDEKAPGAAASPTTQAAPKDALKEFDKARTDAFARHPDSAERDLEKAVHSYPQFAEAWYQLGKLQEQSKPEDAWNDYTKAVAADPQFAPPYEHMAAIAAQQKRWKDVVSASDQALKLNPQGTPQIWYYSAVGNYNVGDISAAEASAKTSIAMDPSHLAPNTEQLLAVMLAGQGDYAGALAHLRSCLSYAAPGPNADLMKQQVAQLEKMVPAAAH